MSEKVRQLREEFERAIGSVSDAAGLQALHDRFLGRKAGALTALLKTLGTLPPEERRQMGGDLNALKKTLDQLIVSCRGERQSLPCPIIATLTGDKDQDTA